jgi:3-phenylpropionate/trans-cinnamate dioxygenase ferredoxin reductase subunit
MASIERVVIVGAGLAGARAAESLRKEGYDGAIALVGEEADRPYIRPPLSKGYLRGEEDLDKVFVHQPAFYDENRIELLTSSTVTAIDATIGDVELADGRRVPFDRLLLATGARPRRLSVDGADLPGVVYLRTRADSDALREAAGEAERIVVIGAGWIGSEVAASLRMLDRRVALVAPGDVPLERVLGREVGSVYRDLHADRGVDLHLGTGVSRIVGAGRVEAVEAANGESIPAELVVVGVGVEPRAEIARAAGLTVGDGIEVGETLESSSSGIFAAGDVASAWHPFYGRRLRIEHWANARFQGTAVGKAMLGDMTPYDRIPYFYSDQYDLGMEYRGFAATWDRVVVRGDVGERRFIAFWLADGRVVAAMNANVWEIGKPLERLLRSRAVIDPATLADLSVALDELAGAADPP